jgi:hypothetical protein
MTIQFVSFQSGALARSWLGVGAVVIGVVVAFAAIAVAVAASRGASPRKSAVLP